MADTAEQQRLKKLSEELRCLVCQNQTLADSNADLAVDLRRQVESMISSGRSDREIRDYMVQRYGDFVLYRPPMQGNTLALWLGPFAMLGGGALIWWLVQRRSRLAADAAADRADRSTAAAAADPQDSERQERARRLLER
jgi:cytochrome c-type biogenesis protein CcmH